MNAHTPQHVREAYEHYIRSYNAYDNTAYWSCFHWPYTAVQGRAMIVHDCPHISLSEVKVQRRWMYHQIMSLQVVAFNSHTAHLVVRLACLDDRKMLVDECDMVYIYKKIANMWKIYIVSEVDYADLSHNDALPDAEAS